MRLRSGTKKPPTPLKASSTPTTRKRRRRSEEDGDDEGSRGGVGHEESTMERSSVKRSRAADGKEDSIVRVQNENEVVDETFDEEMKEDEQENLVEGDECIEVVSAEQKEDGLCKATMDLNDESGAVEKVHQVGVNENNTDVVPIQGLGTDSLDVSSPLRHTDTLVTVPTASDELQKYPAEGTVVQQPSTSTSTPTRVIQPISVEGLKLPSQHTPAPRNFTATYEGRNKMKDFMTPAKVVLRKGDDQILHADQDKDSSSANGTDSEMERLQLKMIQGATEVGEEEDERDEGRRDGLFHYITDQEKRRETLKTVLLLSVLATMHFVMAYLTGQGFLSLAPLWVWSDISPVANRTLELYRHYGILGPPLEPIAPEPQVVEKIVNKTIFVDNEELAQKEKEKRIQRQRIDWWKSIKADVEKLSEEYKHMASELSSNLAMVHDKISNDKDNFASREEKILAWKRTLDKAKEILNDENGAKSNDIYAILREIEKVSDTQLEIEDINLIDSSAISIPGEQCSETDFVLEALIDDNEFVSLKDVEQVKRDLIASTLHEVNSKQNLFRPISEWIEQEFRNQVTQFQLMDLPYVDDIQPALREKMEPTTMENLDAMHMQAMIDNEIEKIKADATGKHDYASLRSGASVISDGPLGTSPSLVQNLPLGNQLISKLGLRFYGHGPDAALEPTFPKGSLGQCWSFEKEGLRKRITIQEWNNEEIQQDPSRGLYATLAVKLAKPIFVTEISIEHVPKSVSSSRDTAIKNFRVFGFEDEDALGYPWLLVESQYDSQSDALQEFQAQEELPNGMPIPRIASVALAIDDNWGAEYSCLYRFRVHGTND